MRRSWRASGAAPAINRRAGEREQPAPTSPVRRSAPAGPRPSAALGAADRGDDRHPDRKGIRDAAPGSGRRVAGGAGDRELQSAALLLAELPELGQSEQRRDRALAAVAPFNHDSGPWRGTRHIRGGRGQVRRGLWMATLVAVRHHPALPRVLPTPAQQREASQSRSHRRDGNSSSSSMPSCDPSISRSPN